MKELYDEREFSFAAVEEKCNCDECQSRPEFACFMDCGECEGCQEAEADREEIEFEIDCAIGRR